MLEILLFIISVVVITTALGLGVGGAYALWLFFKTWHDGSDS